MCLSVYSGLILKNIASVLDPPAQGTRGTPRMAVNVSLTDADKSHKLHSGKISQRDFFFFFFLTSQSR